MTENPTNNREQVRAELENLKRKASLMQYCHGRLAESRRKYEDLVVIATSLLAGIASFLATADPAKIQWTRLTTGNLLALTSVSSAVVFILSVVRRQSDWGVRAGKHAAAVSQYTQYLRSIHLYIGSQLDVLPEDQLQRDARRFVDEYAQIGEGMPPFPSDQFLPLKQAYLQTKALSKELDREPFTPLKKLRAHLTIQTKTNSKLGPTAE